MQARQRYRLTLVGGPNCGTATIDPVTEDEEPMSWPPPMFLYVKGYSGCYRRERVSTESLCDLGYFAARYVWQPT